MWEYVVYIFAGAITFPFIVTVALYFGAKSLQKNKWKAIHTAVGWSTIFYIVAVSIVLNILFQHSFIGWILLIFLLLLAVLLIYQRKIHTDIELLKAFKILWRASFLLFACLYIVLGCIYIVLEVWGG